MRTGTNSHENAPGRIDAGDGRVQIDADDEDTLVESPQTLFEDYDELTGDNDATPDDRRLDPLRRNW